MKYKGVHRQQVFHWIGRHIEGGGRIRKLQDTHRVEYVQCLHEALERGLRLSIPCNPDHLGDGRLITVKRPIICFTEWSLGDSLPHTFKYGRLGLGVPKSFVLRCGGQPVAYTHDAGKRSSPFARALLSLAEYIESLDDVAHKQVKDDFEFVSQFVKRIREPVKPKRQSLQAKSRGKRVVAEKDKFKKQFGKYLQFLEEREWRIVAHKRLLRRLTEGEQPDLLRLSVKPGHELLTVVLPDNKTVNMALEDKFIHTQLFHSDRPPVTVLSLTDVDTF